MGHRLLTPALEQHKRCLAPGEPLEQGSSLDGRPALAPVGETSGLYGLITLYWTEAVTSVSSHKHCRGLSLRPRQLLSPSPLTSQGEPSSARFRWRWSPGQPRQRVERSGARSSQGAIAAWGMDGSFSTCKEVATGGSTGIP